MQKEPVRPPKSEWAPGPWHDEPDRLEWRDQATGLPCLIVRSDVSGALCGYVGVDPSHPLHRCHHDSWLPSDPGKPMMSDMGPSWRQLHPHTNLDMSPRQKELVDSLEAHGGLTYADKCAGSICHTPLPGESHDTWWFGFDCAHAFDVMPGMDATLRANGIEALSEAQAFKTATAHLESDWPRDHYRDIAYVKEHVAHLAQQLHAMQ